MSETGPQSRDIRVVLRRPKLSKTGRVAPAHPVLCKETQTKSSPASVIEPSPNSAGCRGPTKPRFTSSVHHIDSPEVWFTTRTARELALMKPLSPL